MSDQRHRRTTTMAGMVFGDWVRSPNIASDPETYELENRAIARDGRLDDALRDVADWTDAALLDVGCGTGFWLPRYARDAAHVIGVEPDPALAAVAMERTAEAPRVQIRRGSAEHLPVAAASIDVAHARFAYFFGPGAEAGLAEVARVLRPGGVFVAVDNDWSRGEFAELLRDASTGNAAIDPAETDAWWRARGAVRIDVLGAWECSSPSELERILRIEFPDDVVTRFLSSRPGARRISYGFALFMWSPNDPRIRPTGPASDR